MKNQPIKEMNGQKKMTALGFFRVDINIFYIKQQNHFMSNLKKNQSQTSFNHSFEPLNGGNQISEYYAKEKIKVEKKSQKFTTLMGKLQKLEQKMNEMKLKGKIKSEKCLHKGILLDENIGDSDYRKSIVSIREKRQKYQKQTKEMNRLLMKGKNQNKSGKQSLNLTNMITNTSSGVFSQSMKTFPTIYTYYLNHLFCNKSNKSEIITKQIEKNLFYCRMAQKYKEIVKVPKKYQLSKKEQKKHFKTVIFDLDETLIHCSEYYVDQDSGCAHVQIRPYANRLLQKVSKFFEVMIFTAAQQGYANPILSKLDPKGELIDHRLYRKDCIKIQKKYYLKDLRILNRELSDVVLIDNTAVSFLLQMENGIPIIPFYGESSDCELENLGTYLMHLKNVKDVRQVNQKTFRLKDYPKYLTAKQIINKLYIDI